MRRHPNPPGLYRSGVEDPVHFEHRERSFRLQDERVDLIDCVAAAEHG